MKNVEKKSSLLKTLIYIVFVPLFVFALVIYVGNVFTISEKISSIFVESVKKWVEVALDVALIFFPVIAIAWQFKKNLFKYKTFCLDKVLDAKADNALREKFVIAMNSDCLFKATLEDASKRSGRNLRIAIEKYLGDAQAEVKKEVYKMAFLAAVSVVASPQSFGDAICTLFWSCKVTNRVLEIYGFRPRGMALLKLYFNVIFASLLVGSMEEVTSNFIPQTKLPFAGAIIQASAAAYAIFKAAHLTEYYLQHGVDANHSVARIKAAESARKSMFELIKSKEFMNECGKFVVSLVKTAVGAVKDFSSGIFGSSGKNPEVE